MNFEVDGILLAGDSALKSKSLIAAGDDYVSAPAGDRRRATQIKKRKLDEWEYRLLRWASARHYRRFSTIFASW